MKQLNLVPESVRQKAVQVQLVPYLAISVIVGIGCVLSLWFAVRIQDESLNNRLKVMQGGTTQTALPATAVDSDTTLRVTTLNSLAKADIDWGKAFILVQSITPTNVTLSGFSYTSTTSGLDVKISGSAPSNVTFASFIESLQAVPKLTGTKVTSYSYDPATGKVLFSIDTLVAFSQVGYPS